MDFDDKNIENSDAWEWKEDEFCLQGDSTDGLSRCLWDDVETNGDDLMCIFDEQTPIKDCLNFGRQTFDVGELNLDIADKGFEECKETSQMKRRRMLQFNSDANEISISVEHLTSVSDPSNGSRMEDGVSEKLKWSSEWPIEVQDDRQSIDFNGWIQHQTTEGWLPPDCNNENETHCITNEMPNYLASDEQVDVSEYYNAAPEMETDVVEQESPRPSPIKIIRGKNSFLKTPKKLVASVAYPFALIKPCGVQGDVTLKDINQRIHAPPPSVSKQKTTEDPSSSYPTSALSGKPVVVKTKIRTEGGKGSITITRTKG